MAAIRSFRALRAVPDTASRVASPPYDVMNVDEARELARGEPLSFLRVSRAEIELPSETDPYADAVYVRAAENFRKIRVAAPFVTEAEPSLYCYRLQTTGHEQTGLTACYSLDEYDRGLIKRHEHTRLDKRTDRTRHLTELGAQTGLVLLTYRATAEIDALTESVCAGVPLFDFMAPDNVRHTVWRVPPADVDLLVKAFEAVSALYVADGHHRMASASLAREEFVRQRRPTVPLEADTVIATAFPHTQVRILPYNRVVQDLQKQSAREFLDQIKAKLPLRPGQPMPAKAGEVAMYLDGTWYNVRLTEFTHSVDRADALDVARLHRDILAPLLGIGDIRRDSRIDFVGGSLGVAALQERVDQGEAAVAFSMFPVTVDDLMTIADEGSIMPPKSTWFEPKLRDGLLIHLVV